MVSFTTAVFSIALISLQFYEEKEKIFSIWKTRVNVFGFWSVLVCYIVSVMEILLGFSAFTGIAGVLIKETFLACLHYDDVVERLAMHMTLVELAEQNPSYYG